MDPNSISPLYPDSPRPDRVQPGVIDEYFDDMKTNEEIQSSYGKASHPDLPELGLYSALFDAIPTHDFSAADPGEDCYRPWPYDATRRMDEFELSPFTSSSSSSSSTNPSISLSSPTPSSPYEIPLPDQRVDIRVEPSPWSSSSVFSTSPWFDLLTRDYSSRSSQLIHYPGRDCSPSELSVQCISLSDISPPPPQESELTDDSDVEMDDVEDAPPVVDRPLIPRFRFTSQLEDEDDLTQSSATLRRDSSGDIVSSLPCSPPSSRPGSESPFSFNSPVSEPLPQGMRFPMTMGDSASAQTQRKMGETVRRRQTARISRTGSSSKARPKGRRTKRQAPSAPKESNPKPAPKDDDFDLSHLTARNTKARRTSSDPGSPGAASARKPPPSDSDADYDGSDEDGDDDDEDEYKPSGSKRKRSTNAGTRSAPKGRAISSTSGSVKASRRATSSDDKPKPFICPHCPMGFTRAHDRGRHLKTSRSCGDPSKLWYCHHASKSCLVVYSRADELIRHYKDSHRVLKYKPSKRDNTLPSWYPEPEDEKEEEAEDAGESSSPKDRRK
ncbi:hypothetical protein PLICRDRAFT_178610 [Plicaturopsis crispa FD-325 SS-3]|nr:hypothetical protein PLICRDRAFT_178610 [Plicaturopsis crispa FD-325 SS-3]